MTKSLVAVLGFVGFFTIQDYAFAQVPAPAAGTMGVPNAPSVPGVKRQPGRRKVIRKLPGKTMPMPAADSMPVPGGDMGALPAVDATAAAGASVAPVVGSGGLSGAPYKMRVSFDLNLSGGSTTSTTKVGGEDQKGSGNLPTEISVNLGVGYLITPKIEIGGKLGLGYGSLKEKGADDKETTTSTTEFTIGLEPRYNFFDINTNKFVPYIAAGLGYYMSSTSVSPAPDPDPKNTGPSGLYFGGALGCHYFLARHVALTGAFAVSVAMTTTSSGEGDAKTETSTTSTRFNYLKAGLAIYL